MSFSGKDPGNVFVRKCLVKLARECAEPRVNGMRVVRSPMVRLSNWLAK